MGRSSTRSPSRSTPVRSSSRSRRAKLKAKPKKLRLQLKKRHPKQSLQSLRSPKVLCTGTTWLLALSAKSYSVSSIVANTAMLASLASFNAWAQVVFHGDRAYILHDKTCAIMLFLCLLNSSRLDGVPFAFTCAVPYLAGKRFMKSHGNESSQALVCHLTFRLIGWWWTWRELRGSFPDAWMISALTASYAGSCALVYYLDKVSLTTWLIVSSVGTGLLLAS